MPGLDLREVFRVRGLWADQQAQPLATRRLSLERPPRALGDFLRQFTFGHVRQLDAAAGRWLANLAAAAPITAGIDELALVDTDDTIKASYRYKKQGAGYGYSGVKGLNALIGTVTTNDTAPGCARARRIRPAAPPNLWFRNPRP